MVTFTKVQLADIDIARQEYLKSLPVFQDIFLEFQVQEGNCFQMYLNGKFIGYCIANEAVLLEFYIENKYIPQANWILNVVVDNLGIKEIYCKSFDHVLLGACMISQYRYSVIGNMYRDIVGSPDFFSGTLKVRLAEESDLPLLNSIDDEVFEPKELLPIFVKNKGILLFTLEEKLAGCGFITRVHEKWNYYDLGYWTHPGFRGRGFAKQVLSYLKKHCKNLQYEPITGCDINNIVSQKVLEVNGFVSKYKLVQFETL